MADVLFDVSSGSSNNDFKIMGSGEAVGGIFMGELEMTLMAGVLKFWSDFQVPTISESDRAFNEQKKLFEAIPPLLLEQYRGQFVASRDGQIVDSDEDFVNLTYRFFQNAGDVPVYMTKIGEDEGVFVETPFSD
jgi:hypothetical protein